MNDYEVIMTPDATDNLIELRNYIADVLLVPDIALSYIRTIRHAIETLTYLPEKHPLVPDEPWHSRGFRKFPVKNFIVYYRIDEADARVYVLNIIYERRDQLRVLAEKNL